MSPKFSKASISHLDPFDIIVGSQRRLAELRRQIDALQIKQEERTRLINVLQIEQEERIHLIDINCAIVKAKHFINNLLSDDMLFSIFSTVVRESDGGRSPWILGVVCRRWRTVCLHSPTLWSRFRLGSIHSCEEHEFNVSTVLKLTVQLGRSNDAPLHIVIDGLICPCPSLISTFQALITHSDRWETLKLHLRLQLEWTESHTGMFQELIPSKSGFSRLQSIYWRTSDDLGHRDEDGTVLEAADQEAMLPFADCAILTSLHKISFPRLTHNFPNLTNFPWKQITSLHLSVFDDQREILHLLRDCQNLASFTFRLGSSSWDIIDDVKPNSIILPHLKTASILFDDDEGLTTIPLMPYIQLPCLRSLQLGNFLDSERILIAAVDLIERSSCSNSLQELCLSFEGLLEPGADEFFRTFLKKVPQITSLSVSYACDGMTPHPEIIRGMNGFVKILSRDSGSDGGYLLPLLEEINLDRSCPDVMSVVQMLGSRLGSLANPQSCLKRLRWTHQGLNEMRTFIRTLLEQTFSPSIEIDIRRCECRPCME